MTMDVKKLLIAVPTMGGIMKARTTSSLMRLARALSAQGIAFDYWNIDASDIVTARNRYANEVHKSDRFDALLFIDSDMEFRPRVVARMIANGAGVTAAAYKRRELDLPAFAKAVAEHGDANKALSQNGFYTLLLNWDNRRRRKRLPIRNGFIACAAAGTGLFLIRKSALADMVAEGAVDTLKGVTDGKTYSFYGFFNHVEHEGHHLLEDYSFCYRWTKTMGRALPVCIDEEIGHVGEFVYAGTYGDRLNIAAKD